MRDDSSDASAPKLLNIGSVLVIFGRFPPFLGKVYYIGWKTNLAPSCALLQPWGRLGKRRGRQKQGGGVRRFVNGTREPWPGTLSCLVP